MLNDFMIRRTRSWVVGRNRAQLEGSAEAVVAHAAAADEPVLVERISPEDRELLWSSGGDELAEE